MFHAVLTLAGFNANYLDVGIDSPGNIDVVTPDVLIVLGVRSMLMRAKNTRSAARTASPVLAPRNRTLADRPRLRA
jgi:hypothetical protein